MAPYMSWHENGQKESEGKSKNGQQEGLLTEWYENGQKKSEGNLKNDQQEGLLTEWYEDGQKKSEGNWENGKAEGLVTFWYKNGQKEEVQNWKNGKSEGLVTSWHETGRRRWKRPTRTVKWSKVLKSSGTKKAKKLIHWKRLSNNLARVHLFSVTFSTLSPCSLLGIFFLCLFAI